MREKKMPQTFQTKEWKHAAILSYIGMHAGLAVLTAVLPLTIIAMGEGAEQQTLALHCVSMKSIQYWLLGVGGFTFVLEFLSLIASMTKYRNFHIAVTSAIALFLLLTTILMIWGAVEGVGRRSYFQATWNNMDDSTKYFIQTYFSCCGFENVNEWTGGVQATPSSCFAISSENIVWPNGCYDRAVSGYVDPVSVTNNAGQEELFGEGKVNPFVVAHFLSLTFLMIVQTVSVLMLARAILSTQQVPGDNASALVLENSVANGQSDVNQREIGTTNTSNEKHGAETVEEKDGGVISNGHHDIPMKESLSENGIVSTADEKHGEEEAAAGNGRNDLPKKESPGEDGVQPGEKTPWHKKIADIVSTGFGNTFFWIGLRVARYPKRTIVFSCLLIGTMALGMLQRYEIPAGNAGGFLSDSNGVVIEGRRTTDTFLSSERDQLILIVDETNVISTENFQTALDIDSRVKNLTSSTGATFGSICLLSDNDCTERSLFEFWSFNNTVLQSLSTSDIQNVISQTPLISPVFNDAVDISHILGDISRSAGTITSAKAHLLHYVTTSSGSDWEDLFVDVGRDSYSGVRVYVQAWSSRRSEAAGGYTKELPLLFAGFGLIFVYIMIMTGRLSLLEHRVYIALLGVAAAGLAMGGGIGLTPAFGLKWTTLHLIVPFLVIGIGVDDMFVLLKAWNTIQDDEKLKNKSLEERAGRVLQTAGASITVTSLTDLVAFAVGATSELGGFASFSVFVAMCIVILFFLECTFFMACVVLDQRRRDRKYDACLACCYKHKDTYKAWSCSERDMLTMIFEDGLGRLVTKLPFSIICILATVGFTGFMAWGFYKLPVIYDPDWYLPIGSYLTEYNNQYDFYFNVGSEAQAYVIGVDFFNERRKLQTLYENLNGNPNLNSNYTISWFEDYRSWASSSKNISDVYDNNAYSNNATMFYSSVSEFLQSSGQRYINDVVFRSDEIYGSRFDFRHKVVDNEGENVDIMSSARASCTAADFSIEAFPYGRSYLLYEITRIIRHEVYRNVLITILCVFIMVLPILVSLQMGFWVGICVLFTTTDVAGTMYLTGLSIEASTIITLLLSVGLAVDYAAHVGHKYLSLKGTRRMRTRVAVGQIGVAVFNGGFSTFLALVLLSGTQTYSYRVFFTVFSSVIGYGLWNGLVFLPCILSLVGPAPYASANEAKLSPGYRKRKCKITTKRPNFTVTSQ